MPPQDANPTPSFGGFGLRSCGKAVRKAMQTLNLYPDLHHAEDWEMARRLCAFIPSDVLAQICDVLGFIGTPEYCAQRLQEAYANGIDHFYVMAAETYSFPHTELRAFEETIFPAIASLR